MLRKLMVVTTAAFLMALSACGSSTGPSAGKETTQPGRRAGPKPPLQFEKVCLEDLRAVEIISPSEGSIPYGGSVEMVTWDLREICGRYAAQLEVSLDGGRTFESKGEYKNAMSAVWKVPNVDGAQAVVRVTVHDAFGEVSDSMVFANRLVGSQHGQAPHPQDYGSPD